MSSTSRALPLYHEGGRPELLVDMKLLFCVSLDCSIVVVVTLQYTYGFMTA